MIRGTRGYVAPEWFKNVAVTVKVDVYSFGKKCVGDEPGEEKKAILAEWAYNCYMEGRIDVVVEKDEAALSDNVRLQKWIKIAI
ncbi:G-type lectin S-receptor-like serine/threonine-protein kinase LECRK1, partial [Mucuna pruriens]